MIKMDCSECGQLRLVRAWTLERARRRGSAGTRCGECKGRKHGQSARRSGNRSRAYSTWANMKSRCQSETNTSYENYGGRGIAVCAAWQDFENFYADMGDRPEGMTIDRVDPDGNYEPDNCRWATAKQQNNNQRRHYAVGT